MKNFGKTAIDKVTGFKGIIVAKTIYMYGCSQYCLMPKVDADGKRREGEWFDEGRLDILEDEEYIAPNSVKGEIDGCEIREHPLI